MDPGVANADDSGLADELREADVVILSTMYDNWDEPNTSMEPGSDEPNEVLDEEFCLVDTLRRQLGCDGASGGRRSSSCYPCADDHLGEDCA